MFAFLDLGRFLATAGREVELRQALRRILRAGDRLPLDAGSRRALRSHLGDSYSKWKGFPAGMVRASELPSPAPNGHFLRRFGQSDRELVENASDEATVPQILNMLNGPLFSRLMKANSVLARQVREQNSTRGKVEVIFQSIYARRPTSDEMRLAVAHAKSGGAGLENVVWALLNTRQFMFIQ